MKGKKFTAAEKHFESKRQEYEKEIKLLKIKLMESRQQTIEWQEKYTSLCVEHEQFKDWIERLLEYTELDKKDIKAACDKDKEAAETFKSFNTLMKFSGLTRFM